MKVQAPDINEAIRDENWIRVISLLEDSREHRGLTKGELILLGRAILLGGDDRRFPLSDAEHAFQSTLEEDETFADGLIELGWYYYSVDERLGLAEKYFSRAMQVLERDLAELKKTLTEYRSELSEAR